MLSGERCVQVYVLYLCMCCNCNQASACLVPTLEIFKSLRIETIFENMFASVCTPSSSLFLPLSLGTFLLRFLNNLLHYSSVFSDLLKRLQKEMKNVMFLHNFNALNIFYHHFITPFLEMLGILILINE